MTTERTASRSAARSSPCALLLLVAFPARFAARARPESFKASASRCSTATPSACSGATSRSTSDSKASTRPSTGRTSPIAPSRSFPISSTARTSKSPACPPTTTVGCSRGSSSASSTSTSRWCAAVWRGTTSATRPTPRSPTPRPRRARGARGCGSIPRRCHRGRTGAVRSRRRAGSSPRSAPTAGARSGAERRGPRQHLEPRLPYRVVPELPLPQLHRDLPQRRRGRGRGLRAGGLLPSSVALIAARC